MEHVLKLHGMPYTIVSNRDTVFLSAFWKDFFKLQGSKLCMSSSYHPQSDGQTEVARFTPFEVVYGYPLHILSHMNWDLQRWMWWSKD